MTYGHLQADCLYTRISSGPNARCRVWEAFTFTFTVTEALIVTVFFSCLGSTAAEGTLTKVGIHVWQCRLHAGIGPKCYGDKLAGLLPRFYNLT